jgi:hypothetical protein
MATQYSNKPIVTNGLVYALDFGNQKSYVSGSTSAFNLVYSTTTSSLNSYNSGQKGVVIGNSYQFTMLDGHPYISSSYFLTQALTFLDTASEYTVTAIVEPKAGNYSGEPRYLASNLTATGRTWGITYGTSGFTQYGIADGNVSIYSRQYPVGTSRQHVTYRYKSGSFDFFVNGVPVSASAINPSTFFRFQYGGGLSLGSPFGGSSEPNGYAFSGSLGLFYVYNRALSSNEIYSNYLIAAQRYGLPTPAKPYSLDENAYLFLQSAGITDPIITSSINTFVLGLKSASLWDKMIAIYPFVGTGSVGVNLTGSQRWNLKEPSLVTYPLSFTGSWNGSVSGSTPSGSGTNITAGGITPSTYYPNYSSSNAHISILSYDTPTSSSMLAGTGMTRELAVSTLAGDYGTPAAAYSVRKVRTAYSGALMDVRRDYDNTTGSVGYVSNGDLDTGSLLDFVLPGRTTLPGTYSGLAAAYSLRRVSGSYTGSAIDVRRSYDDTTGSIGFNASGNLDTASLAAFVSRGDNFVLRSEEFDNAYWTPFPTGVTTVTANTFLAPDGTMTADTVALPGAGRQLSRNSPTVPPTSSFSMFVSGAAGSILSIGNHNYSGIGTVLQSYTLGNGWTRISASFSGSTDEIRIVNQTATSYTFYIWGAQLNSGSVALPYVKTVASTKTNESGSFDTVSTGWVAQWYDQSGNNRHATQTATGSQPLIVSSGSLVTENGKPAVSFNGTVPTYLIHPWATGSTGATVFDVFSTSDTTWILHGNGSLYFPIAEPAGGVASDNANITQWYKNSVTQSIAGRSDVSTAYVTGNNVLASYLLTANLSSQNNIALGNLGNFASIYGFTGKIQESLWFNADYASAATRSLIENNINNYYSIYTSSNAGYVARWYDQSGNNRHATQSVALNQPQIVSSGSINIKNGRPNLKFTDTMHLDSSLTYNSSNLMSIFNCVSQDNPPFGEAWYLTANRNPYDASAGVLSWGYVTQYGSFKSATFVGNTFANNTTFLGNNFFRASSFNSYINNSTAYTSTSSAATQSFNITQLTIGRYVGTQNQAIQEQVIYYQIKLLTHNQSNTVSTTTTTSTHKQVHSQPHHLPSTQPQVQYLPH